VLLATAITHVSVRPGKVQHDAGRGKYHSGSNNALE